MSHPIVVITGASSGIGAACVRESGSADFRTVGVDIGPRSEADEHFVVDLATPTCGGDIMNAVGDRPVRVLVNNAAVDSDTSIMEITPEIWDRTMAINLRAPFLLSRALHPALVVEEEASIVNVSSVHAVATSPGAAGYAASKGGLTSFTRAMAVEWAPALRVNCILPGAVDTSMLLAGAGRSNQTIKEMGHRHPLGAYGHPGGDSTHGAVRGGGGELHDRVCRGCGRRRALAAVDRVIDHVDRNGADAHEFEWGPARSPNDWQRPFFAWG